MPELKPASIYLRRRAFAAIAVALAVAIELLVVLNALWWRVPALHIAAVLIAIPIVLFLVVCGLSVGAFGWKYSNLGSCMRTPFPGDAPRAVVPVAYTAIGRRFRSNFVTWHFWAQGIGARLFPFGDFYLPWTEITAIEKAHFGAVWLHHISDEVRSPIFLAAPAVRALREIKAVAPATTAANTRA